MKPGISVDADTNVHARFCWSAIILNTTWNLISRHLLGQACGYWGPNTGSHRKAYKKLRWELSSPVSWFISHCGLPIHIPAKHYRKHGVLVTCYSTQPLMSSITDAYTLCILIMNGVTRKEGGLHKCISTDDGLSRSLPNTHICHLQYFTILYKVK